MPEMRKITTNVPTELYDRLQKLVPWGMRNHLISAVLDTVLKAIESDGEIVMGAIMARQFKLQWEPPGTVQNLNKRRGHK